jgi:hypothetical protein
VGARPATETQNTTEAINQLFGRNHSQVKGNRMRGSKTSPELCEEARTIAVLEDNIMEASRQTGLPYATTHDIVTASDDFDKVRYEQFSKYVINTWDNIQAISNSLTAKIKNEDISKLNLKEITGALRDLRQTVENVVNNIHIGDNIQNNLTVEDRKEYELWSKWAEIGISKHGSLEAAIKNEQD